MDNIDRLWREHAELREGVRYHVYLDSLEKPTAGIGHLLTPDENKRIKVGDVVSGQQVERWFISDSFTARRAAERQAREIGVESDWFILALISVNFQLGTKWTKVFKATYPAIVRHDYDLAIKNLRRSKWYRQTPVRVEDFIQALERAKTFKQRPLKKTRTMAGASAASIGAVAAPVVEEVAEKIEPLTGYSEILQTVFVVLILIGVGLVVYARIDDREKGHR